jgi:O-antigen ligase
MTPMQLLVRSQYVVFLLFTLDIFLAGSGTNYFGYDLALRKFFFGAFAVLSVVLYFSRHDRDRRATMALLLALLMLIFVWAVAIPITALRGNLRHAISDSAPLLASGIALLSLNFPLESNNWEKIRKVSFTALIAFAALHILLFLGFSMAPNLGESAKVILTGLWEPVGSEDYLYVFLAPLTQNTHRIYFGSSFLLLLGLYLGIQVKGSTYSGFRWVRALFLLTFFAALWATNTRSLLLGAAAFIPLTLGLVWLLPRLPFNVLTIAGLLVAPFFVSFLFAPVLDPDFLSGIGLSREGSDDLRSEQFRPLLAAFLQSPLVGIGFGSGIDLVRSEVAPYAYELTVLAILMKIGIIGVLAGCLLLAQAFQLRGAFNHSQFPVELTPLYALYFSFILSCFFNPYLFGFFGTFFLLFLMYEYAFLMAKNADA